MDASPTLGGGDVRRPYEPRRVAFASRDPRIRRSDRRVPRADRSHVLPGGGDPRPGATRAYNVACSLTRDGHRGHALDWLDRAVQSGWTDARQILEDDDLTPLRELPRFGVILVRIPR